MKIDDIPDISIRVRNALINHRINDTESLQTITEKEFMSFRNVGRKSLNELKYLMNDLGIKFKNAPNVLIYFIGKDEWAEKRKNKKWNKDTYRDVLLKREQGMTYKSIGKMYCVTPERLRQVVIRAGRLKERNII